MLLKLTSHSQTLHQLLNEPGITGDRLERGDLLGQVVLELAQFIGVGGLGIVEHTAGTADEVVFAHAERVHGCAQVGLLLHLLQAQLLGRFVFIGQLRFEFERLGFELCFAGGLQTSNQ